MTQAIALNWFATLGGSSDALAAFFEHLEQLEIGSAEEMLLVGEQEIEWFEEAGLSHRTKFWAAPRRSVNFRRQPNEKCMV